MAGFSEINQVTASVGAPFRSDSLHAFLLWRRLRLRGGRTDHSDHYLNGDLKAVTSA